MVARFIASPPADQNAETYRQFLDLQSYLRQLEERITPIVDRRSVDAPWVVPSDWTPVPLVGGPITVPLGIYFWMVYGVVEGSTGAAVVDFRVTFTDGTIEDGPTIQVGQQTEPFQWVLYTIPGAGVTLEAQGTNVTILDGDRLTHRVGIGL